MSSARPFSPPSFAALAILLTVGCQQQAQQPAEREAVDLKLSTVRFEVPNMVCEYSCVPAVEKTLAKQPGVQDVQVDLETKTATVVVDEKTFDADAAIAALVDVQFIDTKLKSNVESAAPAESTAATVVHKTQG